MSVENYTADRVINGTYGEVWVDGDYIAEVTGLEAKVSLDKTDVQQVRRLAKGSKVTGMSGKGTLKTNKTRSYFLNKLSKSMQAGKCPTSTIKSKLADPDSYGAEAILLKGVSFDELTLADFEGGKLGEESIAFTFTGWEIIDSIDVDYTQA